MKKSLGPRPMVFPLPAFLVGTYDADGRPNIMTAAWGGIAASEPPCLSVSIQPPRYTHEAILKNKAFTVSIPDSKLTAATDYAGLVSGRKHDKFAVTGLTAVASDLVKAPYVAECPVVIECELYKSLELGSHTLFVGRIVDVKAEDRISFEGGRLDMAGVDPILYNAGGDYHRVGEAVGKGFAVGKQFKS